MYLSSDYRVVHNSRIIAELCLLTKNTESLRMNPRDKEIVSECQQLVAYDGARRGNNTQTRDLHFSDTINKVQSTSSLPNSQFGHIFSITASISDILVSSVKRPIEEGILLVSNTSEILL